MSFHVIPVNDLVRIAAAGGGIRMNASVMQTNDLVRIAAAASGNNSRIFLTNMSNRPINDMVRIAAAGRGTVVFED